MLRDFNLSPRAHRKSTKIANAMSHTIQCPFLSDRRNLRHVHTSPSHAENVFPVHHLVRVCRVCYHPMPKNLLPLHCPIDGLQSALLKYNVMRVKKLTSKRDDSSIVSSIVILIKNEQSFNDPPKKTIN